MPRTHEKDPDRSPMGNDPDHKVWCGYNVTLIVTGKHFVLCHKYTILFILFLLNCLDYNPYGIPFVGSI